MLIRIEDDRVQPYSLYKKFGREFDDTILELYMQNWIAT